MTAVFTNAALDDERRRRALYGGDVFVYSAGSGSRSLVEHARSLIAEAFGALDPETAQHQMAVEDFASLLAGLKPRFIHHPTSKALIQTLLSEFGCELEKTYFDVPRLRTSTSDDYLVSGISYAFHPHRDTWYSAPFSQINWWIPIFPVEVDNVMAFHPRYWSEGIQNGSRRYDYGEWSRTSRGAAATHIASDTRDQPRPEQAVELEPQIRVVPEPGGVLLFSGNQLHSTVPNNTGRTRFSIDFRTVHLNDVVGRHEAPNVDSACTGTSLGDFLRAGDLEPIGADIVMEYARTARRVTP